MTAKTGQYKAGLEDKAERLQLRKTLKAASIVTKSASDVILAAEKAATKASLKATLAASDRTANALLAALAVNKVANEAIAKAAGRPSRLSH